MAWICYGVILVEIGKKHRSKSSNLKLRARVAHLYTRAKHFYIAYSTPHIICFRMCGRSFLCDLWFPQTLRHKNGISIYIYILISVLGNEISMFHISARETPINLKFWGSPSWALIMLQTKFQVFSSLGS